MTRKSRNGSLARFQPHHLARPASRTADSYRAIRNRPRWKVRRCPLLGRGQERVSQRPTRSCHLPKPDHSRPLVDSALAKVEADLKGVKASLGDASVQDFLANPILSSSDKAAGIEALLKKSSPKGASDLTKNLFEVLADNGRLYETDKVIADYLDIMSAHRGEVKVTITTAAPLEKDLQKRLEDSLKASQVAKNGKSLVIENKTNESILGGLVIDFGDRTLDLSVASKVSKLNAQLQGASPLPFPSRLVSLNSFTLSPTQSRFKRFCLVSFDTKWWGRKYRSGGIESTSNKTRRALCCS